MSGDLAETIYALATPPGRSGVAVVRLSGPMAIEGLQALAGRKIAPRHASLVRLRDPVDGSSIDEAIVITFPKPNSFTGEDVAEIQCHGSRAVVRKIYNILENIDDFRIATPGEFTRRAMMNGRLDLTQVEGLADLLEAETESQRVLAQRALDGAVGQHVQRWRDDLVGALAFVEASIDFADEELPPEMIDHVRERIVSVLADVGRMLSGAPLAERVRDGFEVALVGRPNAGKSTLLNALAGRDAALTSTVAGTTRDVLEVRMDLDGLAVTILDMAGLRPTADAVEALGVSRARDRAEKADIRVFLLDDPDDLEHLGVPDRDGDVLVLGKSDLRVESGARANGLLRLSGLTGEGVDALVTRLSDTLSGRASGAGDISSTRQRAALERTAAALREAEMCLVSGDGGIDLVAEHMRAGLASLEFMVGRVDVESVLDVIFGTFCLGK